MSQVAGQRTGRIMWILVWIIGLALASYWFSHQQEQQRHPNRGAQSQHGDGFIELVLEPSRGGHYLLDGQINGHGLSFLLDTGASTVAVPQALAEQLQLSFGSELLLQTANGTVTGYRTQLKHLRLGAIELTNVPAVIAPGMEGDQVLLGMSALRQLEFRQKDGTLVLRQDTSSK